uniref:Uncharacterized protein n=1 Tax=Fagus sylvatica TaxID=28930 RepID=A0A2N9F5F9_FAGSY
MGIRDSEALRCGRSCNRGRRRDRGLLLEGWGFFRDNG